MNKSHAYLLAGLLFGMVGSIAATTISLPYRFAPGQTAPASQLNANFSTVLSAVNRLDRHRHAGTKVSRVSSGTFFGEAH